MTRQGTPVALMLPETPAEPLSGTLARILLHEPAERTQPGNRLQVMSCLLKPAVPSIASNKSKAKLFRQTWKYVGSVHDLPSPGDFLAMDVVGSPIVITRDHAGELRAFQNWRLSNSMDSSFCVDALNEAIERYGKPEIFGTNQGSQFTSEEFVTSVQEAGAKVRMDGKGAWRDNVFIERFWRSLKYEAVYLRAYDTVSDARKDLARYVEFYNTRRPHSALDDRTPASVYAGPVALAA